MKNELSDKARLLHIIDAIKEIENYISGYDYEKFCADSKTRNASIRQLEIIGEAANNVTEYLKNTYPDIKWRQIIGLRNILIHEYFGVRNEVIWHISANQLPEFKAQILDVLNTYKF